MTDQELLNITKKYSKEIPLLSWWALLSTLALILNAIFLIAHTTNYLALAILSVILGLFLVRLFTIYHDFNHHSILTKSTAAKIFMYIFGLVCLCPESLWSFYHDYHHKNNSKFSQIVFGSFPIITCEQFATLNGFEKKKYLMARHPVTIIFSYLTIFLISFCIRPFIKNPLKHWAGALSVLLHFSFIIIISLFSSKMLLFAFVIPIFIMCFTAGYFFYVQHNFPGIKLYGEKQWNYINASLFSSSYIKMNTVWQWISANIGYHHIHHLNSKIPFYNLPKVMNENREFNNVISTTLKVKDIIECLKLKLWDCQNERMVTLKYFKENYTNTDKKIKHDQQ